LGIIRAMGRWGSIKRWRARRFTPAATEAREPWVRRRDELRREREQRAQLWRAAELSVERIHAEYQSRKALLDERLMPSARPIAAWSLRDGEEQVTSSHMGGRPALYPHEPWPGEEEQFPMRFWAQVNFADLAPYAQAFGIAMPSAGLLQMFGGDEGGELARYVPAADVERLELRGRIPINPYWATVDDAERLHRRSLLIDLYPEALVPWDEIGHLVGELEDPDFRPAYTTSEDVPGYSFGWWPFSSWSLKDGLYGWPETRPKPRPEDWVFLAVCESNDDLALVFSDSGFLWATVPAADLAAGDFTQLRCDGESS
jgi:Domain of unknown function (DUF1963)